MSLPGGVRTWKSQRWSGRRENAGVTQQAAAGRL